MSMMPFRLSRRALLAAAPLLPIPLGGGKAIAAEGDFNGFLAGLRRDALALGIRSATVDLAFRYIQFLPHVIELDRRQPEHKMTFAEFIAKVVNPQRLDDARRHLAENSGLLQRVQQRFNVQPRFIVALWGIESDFGKTQGSYSVPAALATLAYEGRRGSLFRGELIAALRILDQGHVRADNMLGSWAGAMGQCQFMPSTFLSYAVDFDARQRELGTRGRGPGQFRHPARRPRQSPAERGVEPARGASGRRRAAERSRAGRLGLAARRAGWARAARLRQFPRDDEVEQIGPVRGGGRHDRRWHR